MENKKKIVLKGVLQRIPPVTYPGMIYGKYIFNWKKMEWELNPDFKL
jgi:hypothetical protein